MMRQQKEASEPLFVGKYIIRKTHGLHWCNIVDAFQTAATLAQEDYKLKHLAEQFQLADNLI